MTSVEPESTPETGSRTGRGSPEVAKGTIRTSLRRYIGRTCIAFTLAVAMAAGLFAYALWQEIDRVAVSLPGSPRGGTTYLLIGSDSRAELDTAFPARFGGTTEHPGERADIVLLIRVEGPTVRLLPVPRDLLVLVDNNVHNRLTLTLLEGPQAVIDSLCRSIGVGVDHLAIVRFNGFKRLIDTVGGIDLEIPAPLRDPMSGLAIDQTGPVRVDGETALAYIRSRRMLRLQPSGDWVPVPVTQDGRSRQAREVLLELGGRLRTSPLAPIASVRHLWAVASAIAVDDSMNPFDLRSLAQALGKLGNAELLELPVVEGATGIPTAQLTSDAQGVLRAFDGGESIACETGLLATDNVG